MCFSDVGGLSLFSGEKLLLLLLQGKNDDGGV